MPQNLDLRATSHEPVARRPWSAPAVEALPPLEELTLQSPIQGGYNGFSFLGLTDPTRRLG